MSKVKTKSTSTRLSPLTIGLFAILCIYVLIMVLMFIWVILTACKDYYGDYLSVDPNIPNNIIGFPLDFKLFDNMSAVYYGFADFTILGMAMNTILYAVGCALSKVTVTCVVAYLCARYNKKFSKIVYTVVILTMIIPVVGNQAAEIQLANDLGIYNQIWGMWIMRANFLGMYFLVFHSVFKAMPAGYYEAAKIDGGSDWQIMIKIAMPLVKYTFLSIFLIIFIEYWNDYLIPNLYLRDHKTLSLALYQQFQSQELTDPGLAAVPFVMTTVLIITTPVIVLFSVFSKRLMGNLTMGGLKG